MMQSLSPDELANQLTEQHVKVLNNFFREQSKYSRRHQRLLSLLDNLKGQVNDYNAGVTPGQEKSDTVVMPTTPPSSSMLYGKMTVSPTIDFYKLYVSDSGNGMDNSLPVFSNLDKEW